MDYRLHKIRPVLRGWRGYFAISDYYRPVPELDGWLRRRIRMCYWKQWRRVRTKVRHLLALGTENANSHRLEPQGLLASRENPGYTDRDDE